MELTFYISVFVTLFVVIDPIGLAPLYVALTTGEDTARRRAIAMRACVLSVDCSLCLGCWAKRFLDLSGSRWPHFGLPVAYYCF